MKNKKPGMRPFSVIGEVEELNAINNTVKILTSKKHEKRDGYRIEMSMEQVKEFIPYLYKVVKVQFIKGCLFIEELATR